MRFFALATDYDGTLAKDGIVDEPTLQAIERLPRSGRKLLLVTGRELEDLLRTFDHVDAFDRVVAENGALLYDPATRKCTPLAEAPPPEFCERLRERGAEPLSCGHVIVATREPHQDTVLKVINELGLELQVVFNKGAVMVLPSGVNKATGLKCALEDLQLSAHNVVAIGDAENDHAFLASCECAVAVANALPALKERADLVTPGARGEGVQELVGRLLVDDLAEVQPKLSRHDILLGRGESAEIRVPVHGATVLLAGTSGGGKSTLTAGFMERLAAAGYQFCTIDPEGDYQTFPKSVVLGEAKRAPRPDEILTLLAKPAENVIVNLLGIDVDHRPAFFADLMSHLRRIRDRTGRPHWIILDEAHHVLPASENEPGSLGNMHSIFMITLEPQRMAATALAAVTHVIAVGEKPLETIRGFCEQCGQVCPDGDEIALPRGEALFWRCGDKHPPIRFRIEPAESTPVRHSRKYATAELTPDRSFFFKGPAGKLNLRAQNLIAFVQLLEGVDDETWLHHLRRGEYSEWFRQNIKNDDLADAAAEIERANGDSAEASRKAIHDAIDQRYTLA